MALRILELVALERLCEREHLLGLAELEEGEGGRIVLRRSALVVYTHRSLRFPGMYSAYTTVGGWSPAARTGCASSVVGAPEAMRTHGLTVDQKTLAGK